MSAGTPIEIWATGKMMEGATPESVAEKIKALFPAATITQRARFISGKPFRITSINDASTAGPAMAALTATGIEVEQRPITPPAIDIQLSDVSATPPMPAPPPIRVTAPQPVVSPQPAPTTAPPQPPQSESASAPEKPTIWNRLGVGKGFDTKDVRERWIVTALIGVIGLGLLNVLMLVSAALLSPLVWRRLPTKYQKAVVVLLGISVLSAMVAPPSTEPRTTGADIAAATEASCRADLQCIGDKTSSDASVRCPSRIEALGKYASRWTDDWSQLKFPRFAWADPSHKVLTYSGNRLEMQNGFGTWVKTTYECDVEIGSGKVLAVRAQ